MMSKNENWGKINEDMLNRLLERKGVAKTEKGSIGKGFLQPYKWHDCYGKANILVTRETAARIARGISDLNPLYLDPDYAANSPWKDMIAPPATISWGDMSNGATDGFPGCHAIWRGVEFEWNKPIYCEQGYQAASYLTDARLVDSKFAGGKAAVQDYETSFKDLDGEFVAAYRTSWHRFSRDKAASSSKYKKRDTLHHWTDDELEGVWDEYRNQNFVNKRGGEPLYYEDVNAGDTVPYIIKGPTTMLGKMGFEFTRGAGGWFVGHEMAMELWQSSPNLPIRNSENIPEAPILIHYLNDQCQKVLGMPGAYEAGYERLHWYTQLLMSWAGDHGLLRALNLRFDEFHWQGDAIRLYADVVGKRVENGEHLVDLSIRTESHAQQRQTSHGSAVVQLPSKKEN